MVLGALAASAPAAGQASSALPALSENEIAFAQITDARPLDLRDSGGSVGFVWGGKAASRTQTGSRYYPMDRDLDRSHSAAWYRANRPDEIVYQCDHTTPATTYQYAWGAYTTLDISNPAARAYILARYIEPALATGQKVIALDNVGLRNSAHICGVFRDGQWVQLYSGQPGDPAYAASVLDYVGWLANEVHARGGLLALNAKVDPADPAATRQLIALGDIWLEEAAFSRGCDGMVTEALWRTKFALSQWAAGRMGWVDLEKTCASPDDLPSPEADWLIGNFLLMRGPHSYFGAIKDGVHTAPIRYQPRLNPPVGAPSGEAFAIDGGGWARKYTHGLVVVNPSSSTAIHYTLPRGRWTNGDRQPLSDTITLGPASATVLLLSG